MNKDPAYQTIGARIEIYHRVGVNRTGSNVENKKAMK